MVATQSVEERTPGVSGPRTILGIRLIRRRPELSIVVVAHAMTRELPRTLLSLTRPYQRGVDAVDYEIVVVDNGSPEPVELPAGLDPQPRLIRLDPAPASPVYAARTGVDAARAPVLTLVLDGARMVTPGAVAAALQAVRQYPGEPGAAVTTPAWHLGHEHQSVSIRNGYGPAAEDAMLADIDWIAHGYRLFDVASLAGSNPRGVLDPPNESCFLTLTRELWDRVGGLDERFDLPGGGYANLDMWVRLLEAGAEPVVLLGEGSFHQVHGGVSTRPDCDPAPWLAQYERLRGRPYSRPVYQPTFVGRICDRTRRWLVA